MNDRIKIVADDKIPFLKGVLELFLDIEYYPGKEITREKILDADALMIRTRTKCNEKLLNSTPVKIITTATIGYDHIDTDYCFDNHLVWKNAPGCNSSSVQQYIASVLLSLAEKYNFNLSEKTIGIVGVGNVGSKVAKLARAFGMKVLLNDPPRERAEGSENYVSLDEIIKESDIITFHVLLNMEGEDKTFHLADKNFFGKLERKPIIINSSRGEVIKTEALINAIKEGKVSVTVNDVWENEPQISQELLQLSEFATPHIAGYSADGKANGTAACINAIREFFELDLKPFWYPERIPLPENASVINVNCLGKTEQQILFEVINYTYDVHSDDRKLRSSVNTFEKQRGDYPIRREFPAYTVNLKDAGEKIADTLISLGFNVSQS
jgi:erythronate-4-phosphate dehydrogenase